MQPYPQRADQCNSACSALKSQRTWLLLGSGPSKHRLTRMWRNLGALLSVCPGAWALKLHAWLPGRCVPGQPGRFAGPGKVALQTSNIGPLGHVWLVEEIASKQTAHVCMALWHGMFSCTVAGLAEELLQLTFSTHAF